MPVETIKMKPAAGDWMKAEFSPQTEGVYRVTIDGKELESSKEIAQIDDVIVVTGLTEKDV